MDIEPNDPNQTTLHWFYDAVVPDEADRRGIVPEPHAVVNVIKGIVRHPRFSLLDFVTKAQFNQDVYVYLKEEYPKHANHRLRVLWRKLYGGVI